MSGGGGGSGNDGSNDMQVSGMEAAVSTEKGISNYSDTRTSSSSYNDPSKIDKILFKIRFFINSLFCPSSWGNQSKERR